MMDRDDIDLLIARYLDGTAQPHDIAEFDRLLNQDPALRRELLQAASLDAMIRASIAESAVIKLPAGPRTTRPAISDTPIRRAWQRPWAWAAAAVLAVCLGVWAWPGPPTPGVAVVQLARGEAVNVATGVQLSVGTILFPGDRLRTGAEASLRISLIDGTSIAFGPDSVLALPDRPAAIGQTIHIDQGSLTGWITPQPVSRTLAFITPQATATVTDAVLQLNVEAQRTVLHVEHGLVAFATSEQSELVAAGGTAIAQGGRLSLAANQPPDPAQKSAVQPSAPNPAAALSPVYIDDRVLFAEDFAHGLAPNWVAYVGTMRSRDTARFDQALPGIRLVNVERNGMATSAVEISVRPGDQHVGIHTTCDDMPAVAAFSLSYAYTYDGPQRKAMQGLMIFAGKPFEQDALPAGSWNTVRWECLPDVRPDGSPCLSSTLIFNGTTLYTRKDPCYAPSIMLEVSDGTLRFTNVVIREMVTSAAPSAPAF